MTRLLSFMAIVLGAIPLCGQTEPPGLRFDVASFRRSQERLNSNGYSYRMTPSGLTMHAVSMGYCIRLAYNQTAPLRPYELEGPRWLDPPTDLLYDVAGKCDHPVTPEQIRIMLQNLLRDRVKLNVHYQARELPAYILTYSAHPAGLHASDAAAKRKISGGSKPNEYVFEHVSMPELALQLGPPLTSRPVVDKTGLSGSFDFTLDLSKYLVDPETGNAQKDATGKVDQEMAIIRAASEQLGLVLKPGRTEVNVLVVDRVEKLPSEN